MKPSQPAEERVTSNPKAVCEERTTSGWAKRRSRSAQVNRLATANGEERILPRLCRRRASVVDCPSPGAFVRSVAAAKAPEDWRSPKPGGIAGAVGTETAS